MPARFRLPLVALVALVALSSTAHAQQTSSDAPTVTDSAAAPRTMNPSAIDRPSDAVRRTREAAPAPMQQTANLGAPKAMMAVGAAAFVVGAIISGDVGTVFMVGGGVVGLYGLWKYLQ